MNHSALLNVMIKAARRAARGLKRDLGELENLQVSLKGPAKFVTLADKRAEEAVYDELTKARPGYGFLGEEGGLREGSDKSHTWIVDPLDGTTNFLHGIPHFAISIALKREDTLVAGLIYNPANDDLFLAERGKGAYLNDKRIRVAGRRQLDESVIACGLPHIGRGDFQLSQAEMSALQPKVAGLRRFGAASLDLAYVAAGRFDGYWERPAANAEAFVDGWFASGDVGAFDADGYLRIVGRRKELIISGGYNVYPREVEDVLRSHPAVHDAAVVGVADPQWGEAVVAFVEGDLTGPAVAEVLAHAAERLAPYKRPKRLHVVAALPRNALGKVVKAELSES